MTKEHEQAQDQPHEQPAQETLDTQNSQLTQPAQLAQNTQPAQATTPKNTATPRPLLLGTRSSRLASTQAGQVRDYARSHGHSVDFHFVQTPGDASQAAQTPVAHIGVGVFTQTLRTALYQGECDIAVHSFKDLPTAPDPRFRTIVPQRAHAADVLISHEQRTLAQLPQGARVGTSAPRRIAQLLAHRPDLHIVPLRGNIDTRMGRVGRDMDAVVLARAGVERLGLLDKVAETLDTATFLPAPAQGALCVEVRQDDDYAWQAVCSLDHLPSHAAAVAERAVLSTLEAGCSAPVAAYAQWSDEGRILELRAGAFAVDGSASVVRTLSVDIAGFAGFADSAETGSAELDSAELGGAELAGLDSTDSSRENILEQAKQAGRALGQKLLDDGAAQIMGTLQTDILHAAGEEENEKDC